MPGRERVILFFYTKYKLKFIAIIYTAVLKYNKAYFKKVSKVYVTVYDLITFRKSMLLYQEKRKKSRGPSKTIRFRNTDIRTVFEIIQMIYERDYKKMNAFIVWRKRIDTELALVEYV